MAGYLCHAPLGLGTGGTTNDYIGMLGGRATARPYWGG